MNSFHRFINFALKKAATNHVIRRFSIIKNDFNKIPDEFFDADVESEKEFKDVIESFSQTDLKSLTKIHVNSNQIRETDVDKKVSFFRSYYKDNENENAVSMESGLDSENEEDIELLNTEVEDLDSFNTEIKSEDPFTNRMMSSVLNEDLNHLNEISETTSYAPLEVLNSNISWRDTEEFPDPLIEKFVPNTSPNKYDMGSQGDKFCPGKLQRRGRNLQQPKLLCHIIDLDKLHHLDVMTLVRFISEDSEILGRKITGLCAKCQRKVATTIKRARNFGILPHLGTFTVNDARPFDNGGDICHDAVKGEKIIESESIL